MRLDKWLWAARFYRTRRIAVDEIKRGRVKVNGVVAKPARQVAVGDMISINKKQDRYEVTVLQLIEMRGPAKVAATMYQESEASREQRERERSLRRLSYVAAPKHPDSRDKRKLRKLRQGLYLKEE